VVKSVPVLILVAALLLAGCGPAMQPATGPETETGEVFMVALPRLVVDFDSAGSPSVLGIKLDDVMGIMGQSSTGVRLDPMYVNWMTNANVQHMELRQTGNGIAFIVNGKPMPHLAWNDASLQRTSAVAGLMQMSQGDAELLRKVLPIVRRLGLDVVVTFPRAQGIAEIPLMNAEQALQVKATPSQEPASAIVRFEVRYDQQGVPGILGITASDLVARGMNAPMAIDMRYVDLLKRNNIQFIELRGKDDGLYMYINGEPLPNLVWDDTFLGNAADLYVQMNPSSPYVDIVRQVLPLVNNADINVMVHFPIGPDQQPIAAKMHY
jgi:hypothetical protein